MAAALDIPIVPTAQSKLKGLSLENLPFGKHFTDHMLEADFVDGKWASAIIRPYTSLTLAPSVAALHYGQAIFEGIKAYKDQQSKPIYFVHMIILKDSTPQQSVCKCQLCPLSFSCME